MQGITECFLKRIYRSWAQLSYKLFRLISSLNSVEYEIGFRLEGFFLSFFFFIIHLLPKLNRLHLRSYGRWSSLFYYFLLNCFLTFLCKIIMDSLPIFFKIRRKRAKTRDKFCSGFPSLAMKGGGMYVYNCAGTDFNGRIQRHRKNTLV